MSYKGIILTAGAGTRMFPMTLSVSKQLLPVYDKPMIYYPLATLMEAGIREILIITTPRDLDAFQSLLGDGRSIGLSIAYATQAHPDGIAQALVIGEAFLDGSGCALILGDNIFHGAGLRDALRRAANRETGATVFASWVSEPSRYGVAEIDAQGRPTAIIEKPSNPPSNYAITGLYFYDPTAVTIAQGLRPSARGELEITDVNNAFIQRGELRIEFLGRGVAWLDAGTPDSLQEASGYVQTIQHRHGQKVGAIEEVAFREGYISRNNLVDLAHSLGHGVVTSYGEYLLAVASERDATVSGGPQ